MDFTLCDFGPAYDEIKSEFPDVECPHSQPGFFENLKRIEQAIDGVPLAE